MKYRQTSENNGAGSSSARQTADNLKKVLAVNAKINSTLNLNELLGIIMTTASEVMRTDAASLMLIDEETRELVFKVALGEKGRDLQEKFRLKMGEGIGGHVAESGEAVIVNDPKRDERHAKRFDKGTGFSTRAMICVPMRSRDKIIGVLQAINPVDNRKFEQPDLELFEAFADQAALSVENARMHSELLRQEKARQELAIAHQIQQNFLPDLTQARYHANMAARSIPALSVGGDFYDVVQIDEDRTGIVIGDVSGKGVPAALYMVRAISEYRFLSRQFPAPAELLFNLNERLADGTAFGMFVTLLYILLDRKAGTLCYGSAGHHPVAARRQGETSASFLGDAGGIPVGLMSGSAYTDECMPVKTGDTFVLYTDGVTEARNTKGEEYGSERLLALLAGEHASAEDCAVRLIEDLTDFTRGAPQHDDTTVLTLRIS